jgi:phosphoglycolate phosphatase
MNSLRTLVLFDIDGTLLDVGGASGAAFSAAFADEFGIGDPAKLELHGRTDRGIAKQLFTAHDIENCDQNFERLVASYLSRLPNALAEFPGQLYVGARELLSSLADAAVPLTLLTGNLRKSAFAKVQHYCVDHFFSDGFFGDWHEDRADLGRDAREKLLTGTTPLGSWSEQELARSVIIGDTPQDIFCARAMGVRSLAVATGGFAIEELHRENADSVVPDLTETASLVDWILDENR